MSLKYETIQGKSGEILKEKFTSTFRTGYVSINNVVLPEYYKKFGERIQNLEIYDNDIWVCSFPKTGTTWTQEMVWCIANDLNFKLAEEYLDARFPFLEHSPLFDYSAAFKTNPDMKLPEYAIDSLTFIENLKQPRFIKTHLPWELLPKQIQNGVKKPKIIYVTRNPKDTCVSYFHHCCLMEGFKGNFEEYFTLFIDNKLCFAPFIDNVLGYWKHRNDENVLFIRFEDLKTNLESVIRKVSKFLNKDLNNDEMQRLMQHLSFESMKNNKAVNYEHIIALNKRYKLIETANGTFMRSGKVGDHKSLLTDEKVSVLEQWVSKNLNGSEFTF